MYNRPKPTTQEDTIGTTEKGLELTERQQQVLDLLNPPNNLKAREIGERLGISRNAVYQTINRLKERGVLPGSEPAVTPSPASARALSRLTGDRHEGDGDGSGKTPDGAPLSAQLLTELARTQQELARIANRLAKYLA